MAPSFEDILQPTSTNMWLLGLPIQDGCPATNRFIFYFINLFLILIEEFLFIVSRMSAEHFLQVTALIPCLSIGILCQYKAFAMFLNRKRIAQILDSFKILYQHLTEEDFKMEEVKRYLKMAKFMTKYYFALNQVLVWVYNCVPLVLMAVEWWKNDVVTLLIPFDILLPFAYDTWKPFIFVYVHIAIGAMTTVVYLVAADTLFFVLTTHICVHFAVICHKLTSLTPATADHLIEIVKKHQYLIELSQEMEKIFSSSLCLNYMTSSVEICMMAFNIVAGDLVQLLPFLLFLSSALLQIFLLSMLGDLLISESLRVGHAAYMSNWYNMNRKTKMTLITIRERTRRPQALTAMKFTKISYSSFSKIISTSWSYFTIIYTTYSAPEE